jgi:alpha-L-fucosidase
MENRKCRKAIGFLVGSIVLLVLAAVALWIGPAPNNQDDMWWEEARFGLFIHWGLYSSLAGEWQGETDHGVWIQAIARIPSDEYERLVDDFNPIWFDADEWVRTAKRAGMKYIVITTKHHDGFCLFDSRYTDYDIMSTPFQRDIMQELAEACRRHGLRFGWYYSIIDWRHPDYIPQLEWEANPSQPPVFEHYEEYMHNQITELLTEYGPVGVMWYDGQWRPSWTHQAGLKLYAVTRQLQPNVLVNNRVDKGSYTRPAAADGEKYVGDFYTVEQGQVMQETPADCLPGMAWEVCMTMNKHWGYNKADDDYKTTEELVRSLVDIASKGGNLLLNVGPTAEGRFPPESIERLEAIGEWMAVNGEAIYGTTCGPSSLRSWNRGRCTTKFDGRNTNIYLHVFEWPEDGRLFVPGIMNELMRAYVLAEPGSLLQVEQDTRGVFVVEVSETPPDPICSVVVLVVRGRVTVE